MAFTAVRHHVSGLPVARLPFAAGALSAPRLADAIRTLVGDSAAMALAMADAATALWTRFLKFDGADPAWPDRDRFVISADDGHPLLRALLQLTDVHGVAGGEGAAAPPTLEFGTHPGVEASSGPLGQNFAAAVGMALAERMLAARFGRSLVDHRTWVIAAEGDLMEGVSHEAASLAGHLRLGRLTVLYDRN
ncbi:MAG: transketolase, partial [Acetobacteraceae bacterium]|nr:transketolase [Acetobacteraceae bacterium]